MNQNKISLHLDKLDKIQEAIKEGVTDYLSKLITEKSFKNKISKYVKYSENWLFR